jgi:hypothetical protein
LKWVIEEKLRFFDHFPAPHPVVIPYRIELDFCNLAAVFDQRTSSLELAAWRWVKGAGHIPCKFLNTLGTFLLRSRDSGEEGEGVRVKRSVEEFLRGCILHDVTEIHDGDPVTDVAHDMEVVGNEKITEPKTVLEILEQVDDLRLDGNIQG